MYLPNKLNKINHILKNNIVKNRKNATFLLGGIALIVLYFISKWIAPTFDLYGNIISTYAQWIGKSFEWIANSTGHEITYESAGGLIISESGSFSIMNKLAIKFYPIAFLLIFIFPQKWGKSIGVLLLAFAALYIISVLRFFVDLNHREQANYLYLPMIYTGRYLTLFFILKYKISIHPRLQLYLDKINDMMRDKFQLQFMNLIFTFIIAFGVMGFIDWFLIVQSQGFIDFLSQWILGYADFLLRVLGYNPYIEGYQINLELNWVYLGTPCLGAGVMALFALLVSIIKSDWINKLIYILIGINILIFANAVRVVVILLHIYINQIPADLIEDYHGLSNNFFYIMVFFMLLIYTRWFADIKFRKTLQPKD